MSEEIIEFNRRELDRLAVIQAAASRQLKQATAAQQLGLGVRQVKRLVRAYRTGGAESLISKRRGRRPENALDEEVRRTSMALVKERYADFSPTFAHEKLTEMHGFRFSVETLRKWMMAEGLWRGRSRQYARIHQRRPRRPCFGELVQIDGSPHDWFEKRGPRCTLIVFIDDATSRLLALRFVPAETTQAYMETLRAPLAKHGRPATFYSDKHAIFRINRPDREQELTQFGRAITTLGIGIFHAQTPQAKGRVERANRTLQDRLVKELRLQKINGLDEANRFSSVFLEDYNRRFAVEPQHAEDAHRAVLHSARELDLILCLHHTRKLSKNLSIQFHNTEYQLQGYGKGYRLRGATLTVCEKFDGSVTLLHQGKVLTYRTLQQGEAPIPIADDKTINTQVEEVLRHQRSRPAWRPPPDHPWRQSIVHAAG